jgi:hypothetical protein
VGFDDVDVRNHPEIVFESRELVLEADGSVELEGSLTIAQRRSPAHRPRHASRARRGLVRRPPRRNRPARDDRPPRLGHGLPGPAAGGGDVLSWTVEISVHLELMEWTPVTP